MIDVGIRSSVAQNCMAIELSQRQQRQQLKGFVCAASGQYSLKMRTEMALTAANDTPNGRTTSMVDKIIGWL